MDSIQRGESPWAQTYSLISEYHLYSGDSSIDLRNLKPIILFRRLLKLFNSLFVDSLE